MNSECRVQNYHDHLNSAASAEFRFENGRYGHEAKSILKSG